jgi:lipoyl(octanoyl) transferase
MLIENMGIISFKDAYVLQEEIAANVYCNKSRERLLLLEHYPVYTIGRGGHEDNILDPSIEAVCINRGGDVTYHGPGQLIGYPIVNLGKRGKDLRNYLRFLEELLIHTATDFGVRPYRVSGKTGVWTDQGKLASIGVGVRHWVSMHGFALNVNNDLSAFACINPCGIIGCPMTSLEKSCGIPVSVDEVKSRIVAQFELLLNEWLPET